MKNELMELFGSEIRWWRGLTGKHRLIVAYFFLSFFLIFSVTEESLLWAFFVVLNFGLSSHLLKKIPTDGIED